MSLYICCALVTILCFSHVALVRVRVSQGTLEGELLDTVTGDDQYYSFKGIPYAAPPVGTLRFKAPQPPRPWHGVRSANTHGSKCPQVDVFTQENIPGSENCLFLNVYTPTLKPRKLMAVMFYIHGGGYKSGSGDVDNYGPDFLMNYEVVLVTINYRLGILGYLCLDSEEVPGNAGLKDQVAALLWVKENIEQFGGDPDNVTIFGQSAGGVSVAYHILSPMSNGLFKRAISMSGVPSADFAVPYKPLLRAFALGKKLGIHTNDTTELLQYLQKVPFTKLYNTNTPILANEEILSSVNKVFDFIPVVEKDFGNSFLTRDPIEILKSGCVNEVDVIIGTTNKETLGSIDKLPHEIEMYDKYDELFVPTELLYQLTPDAVLDVSKIIRRHYFHNKPVKVDAIDEFVTYGSEASFQYHAYRFAYMLPDLGKNRYLYKFTAVSDRNHYGNKGKAYNITGAAHLDDTLYLFDAKDFNMPIKKDSVEYDLIHQVCSLFTNFAKYGNPTPEDCGISVRWPEYDRTDKQYMDIGNSLTAGCDPARHSTAFWENVYHYAGFPFYG